MTQQAYLQKPKKSQNLIPYSSTPSFIQSINQTTRTLKYLDTLSKQFGDCFRVGGKKSPVVCLSNPKAIEAVFTADSKLFEIGEGNKYFQFVLGENSVALQDGANHTRMRQLVTPAYRSMYQQFSYGQLIYDVTSRMTAQWTKKQPFLVNSYMREISLEIILKIVFGLDNPERSHHYRRQFMAMLDSFEFALDLESSLPLLVWQQMLRLPTWGGFGSWSRFNHQLQKTDQLIYDQIRERRQQKNTEGNDVLSLLMSARDEAGKAFTERELRDVTMDFILGSTAVPLNLTWALYWIHQSPTIEEKLRCELQSLGNQFDPQKINQLPYLNAIFQETLRIYPTNPTFLRKLEATMEIMDYHFEPGTVLMLCPYLTHHREDLYAEPNCFQPERFLERKFSRFEYLPFGGGHRSCIGMVFAQIQIKLVVATILSIFQLKIVNRHPIKPLHKGFFTEASPSNLWMICK
ncbi:MAG: cytochrome P450 [Cyanobacteria bacterium P01_G01_bin.39]